MVTCRAASSPGGARQGKRKGLGPCSPALAPRAGALGPRPSPSAPSRSGRRQSSHPPPPPPATPESWQQRRAGEPRRPPREPRRADRAAPTAPASAQEPSCHQFFSRRGVVSLRILRVEALDGLEGTGKGRGGLFWWDTRAPQSRHLFGCGSCRPSSDFLGFGPPCCLLSILSRSSLEFDVPFNLVRVWGHRR